ncbi:hypothetical protein HPB50_012590 [Hyalomma asiaticum]|uniref:Uncharacterized protein n=1 Tax=Hyalomma asiaticum TaxID=266040 RepID=A0ACB7S2S1_HYAAI|nr:hypothetical protein HPB50_012590 [Hyalomma asiaticum]
MAATGGGATTLPAERQALPRRTNTVGEDAALLFRDSVPSTAGCGSHSPAVLELAAKNREPPRRTPPRQIVATPLASLTLVARRELVAAAVKCCVAWTSVGRILLPCP